MAEERYEIIKLLGKGRTGGVYEAEDARLTRKVAMRRFFCQSSSSDVSEHIDEFVSVAQSLSALQHPNLLRVFDAGVDDDGAFIISQLLKGDTVHNRLKEGPLPLGDVYDLAQQLLDALSSAHHAGFIHGAITPGSILMTPRARGGFLYVILDMGFSRLAPLIQGKDSVLSMMADPAILAPELFDGSTADEQADLYMVGHILYMCLAGGHPYAANPFEQCEALHRAGLPPLEEFAPDTPPEFIAWIKRLCQIHSSDRPANVAEAISTLPKIEIKPVTQVVEIPQTSVFQTGPATTVPGSIVPGATAQPFNTTGPLTGYTPPATTLGGLPIIEKKKSKTWIYISAGVVILGAIIGLIASSGGKDDELAGDDEGTRATADSTERSTEAKPSTVRRKIVERGSPICGYQSHPEEATGAAASPATQGWTISAPTAQSSGVEGWNMVNTSPRAQPIILHALSHSNSDDLYDLGWKLTYQVRVISGEHMVGWNLVAARNSDWLDEDKQVSFMLLIERDGEDVIISDLFDKSKTYSFKSDVKSFIDIVVEGRADDADAKFQVKVNGKRAWVHKLNQNVEIQVASNMLICLPGLNKKPDAANPNSWTIKAFKLRTIRK